MLNPNYAQGTVQSTAARYHPGADTSRTTSGTTAHTTSSPTRRGPRSSTTSATAVRLATAAHGRLHRPRGAVERYVLVHVDVPRRYSAAGVCWTAPRCHYDQPEAPATTTCTNCHRPGGPIQYHNATYPAFNTCGDATCHWWRRPAWRRGARPPHSTTTSTATRHPRPGTLSAPTATPRRIRASRRSARQHGRDHGLEVHATRTSSTPERQDRGRLRPASTLPRRRHGGPAGINPHGGYDTTTNKCKVCHAVHRAEGAYYLLRADSQDDACSYCHIGGSAHSTKVVYDLNPAGIDTTNGHTIGARAQCRTPPSASTRQPVVLSRRRLRRQPDHRDHPGPCLRRGQAPDVPLRPSPRPERRGHRPRRLQQDRPAEPALHELPPDPQRRRRGVASAGR